jgi:hypothetical protein
MQVSNIALLDWSERIDTETGDDGMDIGIDNDA